MPDAERLSTIFRRLFRRPRRQGTWVYCPHCKFEMVEGGEWIGENAGMEGYRCANCGTTSAWLFDAPVPLLIGWPLSDLSLWKLPQVHPEGGNDE